MKKITYLIALASFLAFATGCKKDWLTELGTNPNQPSEAPVELLLPPVLTGLASYESSLNTPVGTWMGYGSYAGGYSIDENTLTYYVNQGNPSIWGIYDVLKNADYIEKKASAEENMDYFVAAAKILKAFGFEKLVDAYGDVPYSEAFKGVNNFFPKYDDGQAIYNDLLKQVDSAIMLIQNAGVDAITLGQNDVMYQGDMDKWLKFANTLKLRMLIRESGVIKDGVKDAMANTVAIGFITEDADVNPGYLNTAGKQSPMWSRYATSPGGSLYSDGYNYLRAGGAALEFLKNNSDPRLFKIYAPKGISPDKPAFFTYEPDASKYLGVYYGDRATASDLGTTGTSGLGNGILSGFDAPATLISASQSYFLQAEAALKGWINGDPKELYESGITASFKSLGFSDEDAVTEAEAYYSQAKDLVGWDASTNKLKAIITQKWISMAYLHSIEAWSEYRRTGYPDLGVLPLSMYTPLSRHIPTIWWYPKSESDTNQENYKEAGGPNTDPQTQKVFWDVN